MITVKNAHLKYDHRGIAGLHDISFTVADGEVISVMGPNGCGKSSLLNSISGSLKLNSGSIEVEGKLHRFVLRDLPPEMNVQRYLVSQVDPAIDEEKKVQLTRDFADIFEFTFQLRQNCGQLSQGQRQKVMLTAELINNPDILLLDEPFVHLDPFTRKDILHSLFTYVQNRKMSVIWVTHDQDEAMRFSDRVMVMQHGKIEQIGTPVDFLRPANLFVALFLGYKNFLPIKKFDGKWQTPWGPLNHHFEGLESVLVIPSDAWIQDENSPSRFKVTSMFVQSHAWEVNLDWEGKVFVLRTKKLPEHSQLSLRPDIEQCFLIPL